MAKRFTDNEKWADIWFRKLPVHLKCFWFYILDKCDVAGVWKVDLESASFHLNHDLKEQEIKDNFEGRISFFNDKKWFVDGFVGFQYGTLREGCNPHKPVIKIIEDLKKQGYLKGSQTLKDKDQAQDQYKVQDQAKDQEVKKNDFFAPQNPTSPSSDVDAILDQWCETSNIDKINMPGDARIKVQKALDTWGLPKCLDYFQKLVNPQVGYIINDMNRIESDLQAKKLLKEQAEQSKYEELMGESA